MKKDIRPKTFNVVELAIIIKEGNKLNIQKQVTGGW